jgi:hypothetical protein
MANEMQQLGAPSGVGLQTTSKKLPGGSIALGDGLDATTWAGCKDINALRAALNTANSTYFTATRMNGMNYNDLLYSWLTLNGYKV